MSFDSQPLVSVVTPVYNGAKYLTQCIESVLAQRYQNWEYIIVNNCSTDATLEIANDYAKKDKRIRVINNSEFLPLIKNWNHAVRQISAQSKYCKVVHADDWIFSECIMKMVEIAEANPSVSVVSSYALRDAQVVHGGLRYPSTVVPGREICRMTLLGRLYVFGTPSSLLMRSDLIRNRRDFYNESVIYADLMACYDTLRNSDFGFVHQVLSYSRSHDETVTSYIRKFDRTWQQSHLIALIEYGSIYLTRKEYGEQLKLEMEAYYRFLAEGVFRLRGRDFWEFHREGLKRLGYPLRPSQLVKAMCLEVADGVLNPKKSVERIIRVLRKRKKE